MLRIKPIASIILCLVMINPLNIVASSSYGNSSASSEIATTYSTSEDYTEQTSYFDFDGDGINEKIVQRTLSGTGQILSYYIYKNNNLIWSRENLYQGKITYSKGTLIEKVPVFSNGDSNSSPSKIGQTTYSYSNDRFVKTGYVELSSSSQNNIFQSTSTSYKNPSKDQIQKMLDNIADEKGIPRVIMEAVAWQESKAADPDNGGVTNWRQFYNGQPLIGSDGIGIGIMQVSDYQGKSTEYINRLRYDIEFNIREGANILLLKWARSFSTSSDKIPKIGNMATNYLEHWYFALWAYNGYSETNNPADHYSTAYQTLVIGHVNNVFSTKMTDLYLYNKSLFSAGLLPVNDVPELDTASLNSVQLKSKTGYYIADSDSPLNLRDGNMNFIASYSKGTLVQILSGPTYVNGYSRYSVQIGDTKGTVADMYLKPDGDSNIDTFIDIYDLIPLEKNLNTAITDNNSMDLRRYDINDDNIIDIKDVALICQNYNSKTVQ